MIDLLCAVFMLAGAATVALGYALRVLRVGAAHYDRVARDGGSAVLGRSLMNLGYWAMQPLGAALVRAGISPGLVTLAGIACGLAAGLAAGLGHLGVAALGMGLAAVCDGLDGLVARGLGRCTRAGAALDAVGDRYQEFAFLAGLAVHLRAHLPGLVVALAALLGATLTSYVSAKAEALQVAAPRGAMRRPERAVYLVLGALLATLTDSVLPLVVSLGAIAVVANLSALRRLAHLMRALDLEDETPATPPLARLLRHQLGAAAATAVDLAVMVAAIEWLGIPPVLAAACGATTGAAVNFDLGRRWIFDVAQAPAGPQARRYAGVMAVGAALTTGGAWLALPEAGGHYLAARVAVGAAVSLLWYFPMHQRYVFRIDGRVSGVGPA